jgi:poly-gamma-glutamate capsule biosynthesis protein CapA/YwtB (metallophosphatase superfamily)
VLARLRPCIAASLATLSLVAACTGAGGASTTSPRATGQPSETGVPAASATAAATGTAPAAHSAGEFTIAFAGDVHFSGRIAQRLARDPATVFAQAAPGLRRADLTMVNLETAITTGGVQQNKAFTFRAPPAALTALRDAGIDVATMANNHGADYGTPGLHDSLAAIRASAFPVIGIGKDAAQAYAPYTTTLHGVRVAIIAADQVHDETTLPLFSAGPGRPGVANAYSPELISAVRRAKSAGYVVVVYLHWGVEYQTCPSGDQTQLAGELARAGASAVIGTHAHVLLGAGWLPAAGGAGSGRGTYVAYGLGNYLWWMSFGNIQDDNGVLTLTFRRAQVVADSFAPSHLDGRGVPLPATGAERQRIMAQWNGDRRCANLSGRPPH